MNTTTNTTATVRATIVSRIGEAFYTSTVGVVSRTAKTITLDVLGKGNRPTVLKLAADGTYVNRWGSQIVSL